MNYYLDICGIYGFLFDLHLYCSRLFLILCLHISLIVDAQVVKFPQRLLQWYETGEILRMPPKFICITNG